MSLSLASFEIVGSQKRNFVELKGPLGNGNYFDGATFLPTTVASHPVPKSISHSTTQLISSSSSASCEGSCSSSSNDSAQTYLDVASESHSVSFVLSNCHHSTRKTAQKRKHSDQNDEPVCSLSNTRSRSMQVMGQIASTREPPQSSVWDDLNWKLPSSTFVSADEEKGNDTAGIPSAATTTTIRTRTPMACAHSKHMKVQGVIFATPENLHLGNNIWEDTNWHLVISLPTTKKRKTMVTSTISTKNDTSSTDIDDAKRNKRGRRMKAGSKQNAIPRKTGTVKRRLCKIFNEPDNTEQQNFLSRMPIIPNHQTGIAYLMKNQNFGNHQLSFVDSPYSLYRWLRIRVTAGLVRSSFDFLHRIMKKYYDEVYEVFKNRENDLIQKDKLLSLRDRLAGLWCVYAHFTLEVGCLVFAKERERERSSWKKTLIQNTHVGNGRLGRPNINLGTAKIGDGIEFMPCNSNNSNNASDFEDDQKFSIVVKNNSDSLPKPGIQVEKRSKAALEKDPQLFPKSYENLKNHPSKFIVTMSTIYDGKYLGFINCMKIRNFEEFEAVSVNELAEKYVEYLNRSGVKEQKNIRSEINSICILKRIIRNLYNDSSGNMVEKCPSSTHTAPRKSMKPTPQVQRGRKTSRAQNDLTFDDFSNHAISILLAARDCPLVGNHTAIGVSLGRLIVSTTVMKELKPGCARVELSRQTFSTNIKSAIDVCWDSIDVCHCDRHTYRRYAIRPVSKTTLKSLSNFEIKCNKSNLENEIKIRIQEGIESTLLLPMTLRNSVSSALFLSEDMVISDEDTIRSLCKELNRWSRLGEMLKVNSHHTIRITPSFDSEMIFAAEELPLYATLKYLSDPLNHYEDVVNSGQGVIWQW